MNYAALIIVVLLLLSYFLPGVIAKTREAEKSNGILLLNLLLGWTLIGWIGALVWAVSADKRKPSAKTSSRLIECAACGNNISVKADACPNCGEPTKTSSTGSNYREEDGTVIID